ncbi:integrase core domain-containing protein [Streptomyces sp. NBC_00873]|uniref:integrase core domain-containing protein n=1 Tax=unclassified Streptomyces TaxID=2593676 RepID=UPI00386CDCD7|nr:integrase core domain-containing protein [Streptomyces sp. NBC_00873]WTA44618.1 integrase core domain-containing protein [Streptomyces sp. NBC_00842]
MRRSRVRIPKAAPWKAAGQASDLRFFLLVDLGSRANRTLAVYASQCVGRKLTGCRRLSEAYNSLCDRLGVVQSMGRVGSALDNAAAESFNSLIKVEFIHRHRFATRAEARLKIARWITDFYSAAATAGAPAYRRTSSNAPSAKPAPSTLRSTKPRKERLYVSRGLTASATGPAAEGVLRSPCHPRPAPQVLGDLMRADTAGTGRFVHRGDRDSFSAMGMIGDSHTEERQKRVSVPAGGPARGRGRWCRRAVRRAVPAGSPGRPT